MNRWRISDNVQKLYFIEFLNEVAEELFKADMKEFAGLLFASYYKEYMKLEKNVFNGKRLEKQYFSDADFKKDMKKEIDFIMLRLEAPAEIKGRLDIEIYTQMLSICLECLLEIIRKLSYYCLNLFNDDIDRKLMCLHHILKSELHYCQKQNPEIHFKYVSYYTADILYNIHTVFGNRYFYSIK